MTRAAIDRTPALQLVRNMIRLRQQLEPLLGKGGGAFNLWRLHESRDERFERLNQAWGTHCEVLMKRYKWLMNQIHGRLPAVEGRSLSRDQYLRAWWRTVRNDLPALQTAEEFSPRFWTALATAAGWLETDSEFGPVAALKPKFMLRQFIDEMADREASVSLKILAYSPLTADAGFGAASAVELAEVAYQACLSLHETVTRFERGLAVMTSGSIDIAGLDDETAIARRYSAWLFQS